MRSTYLSLHYHLVFGTKHHLPTMARAWRPELHAYLGGTLRGLGAFPRGVGGVADHVHILVGLKATHRLSDVMRELKKTSSRWVHEVIGYRAFEWQEGYAAFTVSARGCETVKRYIARQEEHHRKRTYRQEYAELLHRELVEFDRNDLQHPNP